MLSRARSLAALVVLLVPGCVSLEQPGAPPHPDFNIELLLKALDDVDYIVTNYAWLLALLGL